MKLKSLLLLCAMCVPTLAQADVFTFVVSGDISGAGTLTGTATSSGATTYNINGASGVIADFVLTGVGNINGSDNILDYPNTPYVSLNGIGLTTTTDNLNLSFFSGRYVLVDDSNFQPVSYNFQFAITSDTPTPVVTSGVPEPATWAMMLLGFSGLGFLGFRKSRKGNAAPMLAA